MQTLTHEAAMILQQNYLGVLKAESRLTKSVLEAVPADKSDYRPDPQSRTALELVRHIAAADNRFVEAVAAGAFNTGDLIPPTVTTPAAIAAWYESRYAENLRNLERATPEQLVKIVDFRGIRQMPAIAFVMMGLHHTIHHRGQLSSYIRAMGGKVPAIYGESYDTAESKKSVGAAERATS